MLTPTFGIGLPPPSVTVPLTTVPVFSWASTPDRSSPAASTIGVELLKSAWPLYHCSM